MMKRMSGVAMLLGLIAMSATSVEAADLNGPGDEAGSRIVVVNHSTTPVRVFLQDAEGGLHPLGSVERGEAKTLEAPAEIVDGGEFSVRVQPTYVQHRKDPVTIKTRELRVDGDETVVLWLERELDQSKVEVRAG